MDYIPNADELTAQIKSLLSEGKWDEAMGVCSDCLAHTDDEDLRLSAHLLMSYCFVAADDPEKAVAEHRKALSDADFLASFERLGVAEDALDARLPFDYCAELFCTAARELEKDKDCRILAAGAYNKAGICLFRQGSAPSEERECFRKALNAIDGAESDEDSKQEILEALIQSNLAECLVREDKDENGDEAIRLYDLASQVFADHLESDGEMCLVHFAICQRCLSDLYRSRGENIRAHSHLSKSIAELDKYSDALSDQLRMHLAVCYNARGTLRFQMGDYDGEVEDCSRSLQLREELDPDFDSLATVYSNRAEAYSMLERHEEALQDFQRAVELFDRVPNNGQSAASAATRRHAMGLIYIEQGRIKDACDAFRSAAERLAALRSSGLPAGEFDSEHLIELESLSRARLGAGLSRLEERDYFDALTETREAIRLLKKLPHTIDRCSQLAGLHLAVGEMLELFDEYEAAEKEFESAEKWRSEGIRLLMLRPQSNDPEEYPDENLENEGSIWENYSGNTPQA